MEFHNVEKPIDHVLVAIAMMDEAQPLLSFLVDVVEIQPTVPFAHYKLYSGMLNGAKMSVVVNGTCRRHNVANVGTVPGIYSLILS